MKIVAMYSYSSKADAEAKAADLRINGYTVQIDETGVDLATSDFTATGGKECATTATAGTKLFVVAGTKA